MNLPVIESGQSLALGDELKAHIIASIVAVCGEARKIQFYYSPGRVYASGVLASESDDLEAMLDDEVCGFCQGASEIVFEAPGRIRVRFWNGISVGDPVGENEESLDRMRDAIVSIEEDRR